MTCTRWVHYDCEGIDERTQKQWRQTSAQYICVQCRSNDDGSFDYLMASERLKQASRNGLKRLRTYVQRENLFMKDVPIRANLLVDFTTKRQDPVSNSILRYFETTNDEALATTGDGDCLFHAVSICLSGDESRSSELKYRCCLEMVSHKYKIINDRRYHKLWWTAGEYDTECLECAKPKTYSTVYRIMALSNLLDIPIECVYPSVNGPRNHAVRNLNTEFCPPNVDPKNGKIRLMWTSAQMPAEHEVVNGRVRRGEDWQPNHFVPLVRTDRQLETCPGVQLNIVEHTEGQLFESSNRFHVLGTDSDVDLTDTQTNEGAKSAKGELPPFAHRGKGSKRTRGDASNNWTETKERTDTLKEQESSAIPKDVGAKTAKKRKTKISLPEQISLVDELSQDTRSCTGDVQSTSTPSKRKSVKEEDGMDRVKSFFPDLSTISESTESVESNEMSDSADAYKPLSTDNTTVDRPSNSGHSVLSDLSSVKWTFYEVPDTSNEDSTDKNVDSEYISKITASPVQSDSRDPIDPVLDQVHVQNSTAENMDSMNNETAQPGPSCLRTPTEQEVCQDLSPESTTMDTPLNSGISELPDLSSAQYNSEEGNASNENSTDESADVDFIRATKAIPDQSDSRDPVDQVHVHNSTEQEVTQDHTSIEDCSDSSDFTPGPLNKFMDITTLINVLRGPYSILAEIPENRKDGMYFVIDNTHNLENRQKQRKTEFWDNCGAWGRPSCPTSHFIFKDNKFLSVKKHRGLYCLEKTDKGKRSMVPLEAQPEDADILTIHRMYQTLIATTENGEQFKRKATWIEKAPNNLQELSGAVAVVEYVGVFPGYAFHGNVKNFDKNQPYTKSKTATKRAMQDLLKHKTATAAQRELNNKTDDDSAKMRNIEQLRNFKYNIDKEHREQCGAMGNEADHVRRDV